MIITPVAPADLPRLLALFLSKLDDSDARIAFRRIVRSGAERARGASAERHRLQAALLARSLGLVVHPGSPTRNFGWDGHRLRGQTEAYVLLHEIAHYQLATPRRRRRREFGLGPGPETGGRHAAERATILTGMAREREEAMASLLGILMEAELKQPALASFLDQNWLEGAGRSGTSAHFQSILAALRRSGLVDAQGRPNAIRGQLSHRSSPRENQDRRLHVPG